MDFTLSSDQSAVLTAIDTLAKPFTAIPTNLSTFDLYSEELDRALDAGGFFDIAADADLGPLTAALVVDRLATLPFCSEVAVSMVVRATLCADLPRPVCLVAADQLQHPIRFLSKAASVLVMDGDAVRAIAIDPASVASVHSLFAYPMGKFVDGRAPGQEIRRPDIAADKLRHWWQVALAVEIAGLLKGAIDSTVTYVTDRHQFGRAIGSFQAVRHRMAEASVRATGVRWMALEAAATGNAAQAALAALHAQESANAVIYDLHQFLGAMGITLAHPLHLWTYRLKALLSEMGGRAAQGHVAAKFLGR